ncbi:hypothetical protein sscle_06g048830 [Sclerotinia sclerotiorum 1980 UF-70]|uniref:DUF7918 domain-containing protein n=1 Tax=Sclerotinia sclerotiorum (strain ATCC 18683 / 1980 / Ss-1) TaxID=665079 RepID=A0A1D9Q6B6_SCLS1|nr:hypothetical protein sscle_06g048830 [Sclerotinia sclerotiorum 1980 UF-70]
MPAHKGIKLHIISQWELKMHPEFPHPESTQFTFRSPKLDREAFEGHGHSPATKANDSKADRLLGRQSSIISVYIPSASGSRFFVRYNVCDAADQSQWFYFKLYMNGRHITSWGTNSKTRPTGQVMKALFEPGAEWDYKEGKTTYKNPGTEFRPFFFRQEDGCRGAADDGGLIEIKVFRARGRKRRNPKLEQYKDQSKYGVVMPNHGLVEKPQDARYYDWHLKDAKDNPFATFKFHYRSWESLQVLHLIPADHPRILQAQVPSMARYLMVPSESMPLLDHTTKSPHTPTKYLGKVYTSDQVHDSLQIAYPPLHHSGSPYSPDQRRPWMSRAFDIKPLTLSLTAKKDHRDAFIVPTDPAIEPDPFYTSVPKDKEIERRIMPMSVFTALSIDGAGSTSSHEWLATNYKNRPLPEIPSRNSSAASRASATSRAPSVTPSLLSYIDRDQSSPEPIIGTAIAVSIDSDISEISIAYEEDIEGHFEQDHDFEGVSALSPPPTRTDSKRQGIISSSPIQTSFPLSNVTNRKPKHSSGKPSPFKIPPGKESAIQGVNEKSYTSIMSDENSVTLSLTESEWMRRTPSPAKETLIEKLCIPEKRAKLKHRLLSPERMAEMMELSMTEDDETGQNDGDLKSWDKDRGLDGGAIELVALHRHYHQQSQQSDQSGAEGGDVGNTFDDYEVNAMNMREGNINVSYENRMSMSEGNWI